MKIGFLEPHLRVCGGIRRILELSNRLVERGHEVNLYPEATDDMNWFDIRAEVRPYQQVFSDKMDVLVFNLESQYDVPTKTKAANIVYYILHAGFLYKYPDVCRASYQADYHRLANSSWTARKVEAYAGLEANSIPVIGGGINTAHFYPAKIPKEINVLTMGQPKDWKGHDTVKEACQIAGVGCQSYYGMGIEQDKMAEEYGRARVFVVGSWFEGWCQPAIEAMACGVPLVTTDNGGIRDYVVHEGNALVVPIKDPQAMAEAIKRLLNDEVLAKKLSENGIHTAARFSWERMTDKFEKYLRGILEAS